MKLPPAARPGFSLVEAALALGIAAFCLLVLFALLPIGLNSNASASRETEACGILSGIVADLRACTAPAAQAATTAQYGIPIPATPVLAETVTTLFLTPAGAASPTPTDSSNYRLDVTFRTNGPAAHAPTVAQLRIRWPANAEPPNGSLQTLVVLNRQ